MLVASKTRNTLANTFTNPSEKIGQGKVKVHITNKRNEKEGVIIHVADINNIPKKLYEN